MHSYMVNKTIFLVFKFRCSWNFILGAWTLLSHFPHLSSIVLFFFFAGDIQVDNNDSPGCAHLIPPGRGKKAPLGLGNILPENGNLLARATPQRARKMRGRQIWLALFIKFHNGYRPLERTQEHAVLCVIWLVENGWQRHLTLDTVYNHTFCFSDTSPLLQKLETLWWKLNSWLSSLDFHPQLIEMVVMLPATVENPNCVDQIHSRSWGRAITLHNLSFRQILPTLWVLTVPLWHYSQLPKEVCERDRERGRPSQKTYLRGISLQWLHLSALASHIFFALMCAGASGQGDSIQGRVALKSYLRR